MRVARSVLHRVTRVVIREAALGWPGTWCLAWDVAIAPVAIGSYAGRELNR